MHIPVLQLVRVVLAAMTAGSIGYCILATFAGVRFARRKRRGTLAADLPFVSVLKPVKGADPEMYEALRSHCLQDYPEYEMLCGVTEANDPAVPIIEELMREFPGKNIRVVLCDKRLGVNGKVSSLIQLVPEARAEFLVVDDSDIRVEPDYMSTVISELQQPGVGLVTCLYRGVPSATLPSRLEALGISTDFMPGVLAADLIEGGVHFGLGSTLAFRKSDLAVTGGFEAIADYLADDYELGVRISDRKSVYISNSVVETHLPAYGWRAFSAHQLRWARTIRASRPGGYLGLLVTFTFPWALAVVVASYDSPWAWGLAGAAVVCRFVLAACFSRAVLGERSVASILLLPVRDLVAVGVWLAGWLGNSISWRGERFVLNQGKLTRK